MSGKTQGQIAYEAYSGEMKPGGYPPFGGLSIEIQRAWQLAGLAVLGIFAAGPSPATKCPQPVEPIVDVEAQPKGLGVGQRQTRQSKGRPKLHSDAH